MQKVTAERYDLLCDMKPAERREACRAHFGYFYAYYFAPYVKAAFAPFHYDFFEDCHDLMDGTLSEAVWCAFRESAKTSIAKGLLVHACAYGWAKYVNVDSQDKINAERFLFDCAVEMRSNPRLAQDFGVLYPVGKDPEELTQKQVANFITSTGVRVEAHSTQESVRGRVHAQHRPDLLFLDDFETAKSVRSAPATEAIKAHIQEFYGGLDAKARVVYLCNYISEFGVVQWLLDRAKTNTGIRVRNVPAIIDGIPSWPQKYDMTDAEAAASGKVSLESKRRQMRTPDRGDADWQAEMLNQPVDLANAEFRKEWFVKSTWEEAKRAPRRYLAVDTAVSKDQGADETGFALCYAGDVWHLAAWGERISPDVAVSRLFELWDAHRLDAIGIEDTQFLSALRPHLDAEMKRRGAFLRIVPLSHGGRQKEERIRALIPRYEAGAIRHIEGECPQLEGQLLRFPSGQHDDVADAAAYLAQLVPHGGEPGDSAQAEDVAKNVDAHANRQESPIVIGVSSQSPVSYVVGNAQGLFYNRAVPPEADAWRELSDLVGRWPQSFLVSDQVGDSRGLRELQERWKGRVTVAWLRADPKSQKVTKWGTGQVDVAKSATVQQVADELRGGRLTLNGTLEDWAPLASQWASLRRSWEDGPLGEKVATWDAAGPDGFVKALLYWRVGMGRYAKVAATVVGADPLGGLATGRIITDAGIALR